jgi:energy-converting hydrogenase A subunit M
MVLLLIVYIVLIGVGTSVRRLSSVFDLASTTNDAHQGVVVAHDDEDVDELALMMTTAMEKVLEADGLLVMSDGSSSSKTTRSPVGYPCSLWEIR